MESVEEGGGERGLISSPPQLDVDPVFDDGNNGGDVILSSRRSRYGHASNAGTTPCLSLSSPLTPSSSDGIRLVACEYEEICDFDFLPKSSTSSSACSVRDEEGFTPAPPTLSESHRNFTSRNFLPDDSGANSIDRMNNSTRDETGAKRGVSSYFRKKAVKEKRFDGVITRVFMRFWGKKNNKTNEGSNDEYLDHEMFDKDRVDGTDPRRFTYKELANATDNFSPSFLLGRGGFGAVYRGFLKDMKLHVAIKRISQSSSQGEREFIAEIKVLGQLRHRNLVPFVGWCREHQELMLVYKFMPNGSLDSHLFSSDSIHHLDWNIRYNIVLGLASALQYLHEEWVVCVIHRDIKPSNVVLDSEFNAMLTDFGLARFAGSGGDAISTVCVAGTYGYMAPEYLMEGKFSKESDIYSFGSVALEIACGRRSVMLGRGTEEVTRLVEWVWNLHGRGRILEAADKRLDGKFDRTGMERVLLLGLWCSHPDKKSRPSVGQVIDILKLGTQIPTLPLTMPVPVYSSTGSHHRHSFSRLSISQTLPESSADRTQMVDRHQQASEQITGNHKETSNFEYKDNTILAAQIPTEAEEKCVHPVGNSVPTTRIVGEDNHRVPVDAALSQNVFNVGIATDCTSIAPLQSYHVLIIKGLIASLHEILKSDPKVEEVVDSVRIITSMLATVGVPLDDWNSLSQYVLQVVKEINNLRFKLEESEADPKDGILPFLLDEIDSCKKTNEEDAVALVNSHRQLHCAIQEHTQLQKQLMFLQNQIKDAEDTCFLALEEVNIVETRIVWNETRLEFLQLAAASAAQELDVERAERKHAISVLSESVLSRISSFSFDV